MTRPRLLLPLRAFLFAAAAAAAAGAGWRPSPDAELCKILPVAAIQELLGVSSVELAGSDREDFHSCTANAGDAAVKVEHHTPGQAGLPADVPSGLAGVRETIASTMTEFESQDFGDIGCYRGVLELMGQRTHTAACFHPAGYYTIGVSRPGAPIPLERVAELLEKTIAAHRKT